MDTIRTYIGEDTKLVLRESLFTMLESVVEDIEKKYYDNKVSIFYDDYKLKTLRIDGKGFTVYYENSKGQEINERIRFKDIIEEG